MTAEAAALLVEDGDTVAVSGFTPSGCPKAVPLALAQQVRSGQRKLRLGLLSGASTGEEIDSGWAELGMIARRLPYMTSKALRTAVNGGGVGPHFDDYDVFLLQGIGRRRWQIANQSDRTIIEGAPLRILKDFRPVHDWVLETGDLLYLPPHWAHNGIAIGECMTYSVGFRSPSFEELGREFLYWMAERQSLPGIYADPGLKVQKRPARIDPMMVAKITQMLANIRWQRSDVAAFLGEYLSEPKPQIFFEPPENPPAQEDFARQVAAHGVRLHRKSLMLWTDAGIYLNGEKLDCSGLNSAERELLTRFADTRILPPTACSPALLELLYGMLVDGFLNEIDKDSAEE